MGSTRRLWIGLAVLLIGSFSVLLWVGADINRNAPPMPERVTGPDNHVLYTRADIEKQFPAQFIDMLVGAGMRRTRDRRGKDTLTCPRGVTSPTRAPRWETDFSTKVG